MQQNMQRKTVNLDGRDAERLAPYLDEGSQELATLREITDDELTSESAVLRALLHLGHRAVMDEILEAGYKAWAESWDEEDEAWSKLSAKLAAEAWRRDEP